MKGDMTMNASKTIKNTIVKVAVACVLATGLLGTGTGCDYHNETSGFHRIPGQRNQPDNPGWEDQLAKDLTKILSAAASGVTTGGRYY